MKPRIDHKFPRLRSAKYEETQVRKEYKSGATFQGQIQDYKKVGAGVFTWPNGDKYEGEFIDNARYGKGKQIWADGSEFEGCFLDDVRHGQGSHMWANGEKYCGTFFRDRRHGKGEYTWPDSTCYKGSFYTDRKEGYGTLTFSDGRKFQGLYKNDEREGPGVMTYPDGSQDVGLWKREHLVRIGHKNTESFTMKDHSEYDYIPEDQVRYLDAETAQNRKNLIDGIVNPPEEFHYDPDLVTETGSIFSDTLDIRSQAADVECFEQAFFADIKQYSESKLDNRTEKRYKGVKAWNNTPSFINMQKHIIKHKAGEYLVDFDVETVCQGSRKQMGGKGLLEIASENLIEASVEGDLSKVQQLLNTGNVTANVADATGFSPLIAAAVNWHQDIIHCLLDNGADVNQVSDEGVSALAACHVFFYPVDRFCYNIAERYMEKPPDFEHEAGYDVNEAVKSILASNPKKRTATAPDKKPVGDTDTKRIQELRKEYTQVSISEVEREENNNETVKETNRECQTEGEAERKIGVLNIKRHKKVMHSSSDTLDSDDDSRQYEFDEDTHLSEFESNTSLHNMDIDVSDQLIDRCATQLSVNDMVTRRSAQSSAMGTARRLAVEKSQHVLMQSTIRLLLHRGADPNASFVPMPVLFFAVKAADTEAVKLLLLKGANTEARLSKEKGSLSVLHIAAALPGEEGVAITALLLDSLGNPDVRAAEDDSFINRLLEEEWKKDAVDEKSQMYLGGRTPLQIACARDDNYQNACKVVHLLLDHHANPNLLCNGFSSLALAISSGNDLAVDVLLSYGADPSQKLTHGVGSALCAATSTEYEHRRAPQERIDLVDKLMNAGADILAPIPIGPKRITGTAVDYAYYMFNLDRRIAHMPYHALTHAERETYNARRQLLSHVGGILRNEAVDKERKRLETEEAEGKLSRSPSPNFVYTGSGAQVPSKGSKEKESGHVSFQEVPPATLTDASESGIITVKAKDAKAIMSALAKRKDQANARKPLFKYCYECGRSVGVRLSACTRCKEVYYCSKACKLKAWNARHKEECIRTTGQSRSPSPKGGARIDSPTPATDPDKGRGTTVRNLAGNMAESRIKMDRKELEQRDYNNTNTKNRLIKSKTLTQRSHSESTNEVEKDGSGSRSLDSRLKHLMMPRNTISVSADTAGNTNMDNYSFI